MNKTLVDMVETTLAAYPQTRNSDIDLTIQIWKSYYPQFVIDEYVNVRNLFELPREDNIKRVRATIQNVERRYLPTVEAIFKERARLSIEWKNFLGYRTPEEYNGKLHLYFAQKFGQPVQAPNTWQAKRKAEKREALEAKMEKLL